MSVEELVPEALRPFEPVLLKACEFFQANPNFAKLNPNQMYLFREIVEECQSWEKLKEEINKFIEKQIERESRGALAGWEIVGGKLLEGIDVLLEEHQDAARRHLGRVADRLEAKMIKSSREIKQYLNPPQSRKELLQEHQKNLRFWLAKDFLEALYKLYRGQEVLREESSPGNPYCRSLEVGP